jgi:hypothetical protein
MQIVEINPIKTNIITIILIIPGAYFSQGFSLQGHIHRNLILVTTHFQYPFTGTNFSPKNWTKKTTSNT